MSSPHKTGRKLTRGARIVAEVLKNAVHESPEDVGPVTIIIAKKRVVVDISDDSEASDSEYVPCVKRAQAQLASPFAKEDLLLQYNKRKRADSVSPNAKKALKEIRERHHTDFTPSPPSSPYRGILLTTLNPPNQ